MSLIGRMRVRQGVEADLPLSPAERVQAVTTADRLALANEVAVEEVRQNEVEARNSQLGSGIQCSGMTILDPEHTLEVRGSLTDARIDVGKLVVSQGASVSGSIKARELYNMGSLDGEIVCASMFLYRGSITNGTVEAQSLGVQQGSSLQGRVSVGSTEALASTAAPPGPHRAGHSPETFHDGVLVSQTGNLHQFPGRPVG